jgi:hypothetical protein
LSSAEKYPKGPLVERQIELQRASNRSALPHAAAFASHRRTLTRLLVERAKAGATGRLCVLGAGNAYDLDFPALTRVFSEIHLVDLDRDALDATKARQEPEVRERLRLHAPLDLSGMLGRLDAWGRMEVTPDELMAFPNAASRSVAEALPGPFDVVASTCLLTQMQRALVETLSDRHRLFEALRQFLNLAHLRTLARLIAPDGRALLVSDLVSDVTYPLASLDPDGDHLGLLPDIVRSGNLIYAANPELLALTAREDPFLAKSAVLSKPLAGWIWLNGEERRFLVYALELTLRPRAP